MDFSVSPFIAYLLAWLGIVGGIGFLFSHAEDSLKPEIKQSISNWLKNLDPVGPVKNWPGQFADVFDRIFGEKHLSWKCSLRSSVFSMITLIIVIVIWWCFDPEDVYGLFWKGYFARSVEQNKDYYEYVEFDLHKAAYYLTKVAPIFVTVNLVVDYISLLETRYMINLMSKVQGSVSMISLLMIDILATAVIFLIGFYSLVDKYPFEYQLPEYFKYDSPPGILNPPISFLFLSTFGTSVWLWIYAISGFIVKLAQRLDISWGWLKRVLNIDEKPLRSMAMVSILIVTIIFIVVPFVR